MHSVSWIDCPPNCCMTPCPPTPPPTHLPSSLHPSLQAQATAARQALTALHSLLVESDASGPAAPDAAAPGPLTWSRATAAQALGNIACLELALHTQQAWAQQQQEQQELGEDELEDEVEDDYMDVEEERYL